MHLLNRYTTEREKVVLDSLYFLRNQEKTKSVVKWDSNKCNFDHHLINLRCIHGNISQMKIALARVMCSVHTSQVCNYLNYVINSLRTFNLRNYLRICRSIGKKIISLKIDHENDFREFIETFNIVSIIETSKCKTALLVVNELLQKYDLLCTNKQEEAIIMMVYFQIFMMVYFQP
jgi:hypothetical protein